MSVGLPDGEEWFITSLLQNPMVVSFTPLQLTLGIAHGDLMLVYGCSAMEIHFMMLQMNSSCADVASRVSLEFGSECCNRGWQFLHATRFSTFVGLCGLPLCGWAIVVPRRFHFTITALTVDRGSSRRAKIWGTYLLEWWHPMKMPRWKSPSSSVRPFYCQFMYMDIAWLCAQFYTPVSNWWGWKSQNPSFEGVSTYFYEDVMSFH